MREDGDVMMKHLSDMAYGVVGVLGRLHLGWVSSYSRLGSWFVHLLIMFKVLGLEVFGVGMSWLVLVPSSRGLKHCPTPRVAVALHPILPRISTLSIELEAYLAGLGNLAGVNVHVLTCGAGLGLV